ARGGDAVEGARAAAARLARVTTPGASLHRSVGGSVVNPGTRHRAHRGPRPGPKTGGPRPEAQHRGPRPGPKTGAQDRGPRPGPKTGAQDRGPRPGPKTRSPDQDPRPEPNPTLADWGCWQNLSH